MHIYDNLRNKPFFALFLCLDIRDNSSKKGVLIPDKKISCRNLKKEEGEQEENKRGIE